MRSSIVGVLAAAQIMCGSLSSRAQGADRPPWAVRLDSGIASGGGNLQSGGPDEGVPPPIYLGVNVERGISPSLFGEVTVSAGLRLGWIFGGTADFAVFQNQRFRLALGAGPLIIHSSTDNGFGWGTFAQAVVGGEIRLGGGALVALGITSAVALQHAGHGPCGVDTCNAWMTPGDLLLVGRVGVGYAF